MTQEIQTESALYDKETEICSGRNLELGCTKLGSDSGKSNATGLRFGSSGAVSGANGPSSVEGKALTVIVITLHTKMTKKDMDVIVLRT